MVSLLAFSIGCAPTRGAALAQREARAHEANELASALASDIAVPKPGQLRVRLAFGADADLDLYVTDPAQETAYFANSPTRLGARLTEDMRCDSAAPRVETVAIDDPPAGRYRVGVDYSSACGADGPVSFVVVIEFGGRRESQRGAIAPGEFLAIVLESTVP